MYKKRRRITLTFVFGLLLAAFIVSQIALENSVKKLNEGKFNPKKHLSKNTGLQFVPDFKIYRNMKKDNEFRNSLGGIFPLDSNITNYFFGTYINGDKFTGTLYSNNFTINAPYIIVPVTGYPTLKGNSLALILMHNKGQIKREIVFNEADPQESVTLWEINCQKYLGYAAYFCLEDKTTSHGGWLGIATPFFTYKSINISSSVPSQIYPLYLVTILTLLFMPGIAVLSSKYFRSTHPYKALAIVPIPGLVILFSFGFFIWVAETGDNFLLGKIIRYSIFLTSAVVFTWNTIRYKSNVNHIYKLPLKLYSGVVLVAIAYSLINIDVAQEHFRRSSMRGRMVASPPDHAIPYYTGVFIFHGKSGTDRSGAYFWGWSFDSRGPLMGFMNAATFNLFGLSPSDPPQRGSGRVDKEGYFITRINGILTNSLILLSCSYLIYALGGGINHIILSLFWLSLCPLVFINVSFTWPKLFSAYFAIIAIGDVLSGNHKSSTAFYCALSYLAHPVGAFLTPAVVLIAAFKNVSGTGIVRFYRWALGGMVQAGLIIAFLAPWLIYKIYLNNPNILLLKYPLGDGNGLNAAQSVFSWIRARYYNFTNTVVPLNFFFGPYMYNWTEGSLNQFLRWAVQYAKTLPGHLGFSMFWLSYYYLIRKTRVNNANLFRVLVLVIPFLLTLVYWGYSSDGLGRNSLEPFSVLMIIYTASQMHYFGSKIKLLLLLLSVETLYVIFIPMLANPDFQGFPTDLVSIASMITIPLIIMAIFIGFLRILSKNEGKSGSVPDAIEAKLN